MKVQIKKGHVYAFGLDASTVTVAPLIAPGGFAGFDSLSLYPAGAWPGTPPSGAPLAIAVIVAHATLDQELELPPVFVWTKDLTPATYTSLVVPALVVAAVGGAFYLAYRYA